MRYQFKDFTLDIESLELKQGGALVEVEPQVFSLLACLIENRDRVVSKDELIEMVWDGRIVSDGALNSRINSARKAVGDDGKAQAPSGSMRYPKKTKESSLTLDRRYDNIELALDDY